MKLLATLALAMVLIGCPQKGAYHDAVTAEHDFKLAVQAFQQAEITEFQAGRIDAATHHQFESGIELVGKDAQVLVTSLQQGAANTTIQQNFATVGTALSTLANSGAAGIKNPETQKLIVALVKVAQDILSHVGSLLSVPVTAPVTTGGN